MFIWVNIECWNSTGFTPSALKVQTALWHIAFQWCNFTTEGLFFCFHGCHLIYVCCMLLAFFLSNNLKIAFNFSLFSFMYQHTDTYIHIETHFKLPFTRFDEDSSKWLGWRIWLRILMALSAWSLNNKHTPHKCTNIQKQNVPLKGMDYPSL